MIKVGILGAGGIAALSHLPEIAAIDGMQVTHICGRSERRLRLLCDRFAVPRYSTNWNDLLNDRGFGRGHRGIATSLARRGRLGSVGARLAPFHAEAALHDDGRSKSVGRRQRSSIPGR